jgi:ribosome-binding factor A
MRTLELALAEDVDEDVSSLVVSDVAPAPDAGRLRVVVEARRDADLAAIDAKLRARAGRLRHEVAGAIHRKKTPLLSFVVVPEDATAG